MVVDDATSNEDEKTFANNHRKRVGLRLRLLLAFLSSRFFFRLASAGSERIGRFRSLRIVPVACLDFHLHSSYTDIPDWGLCFLDCVVLILVLADCPHCNVHHVVQCQTKCRLDC